VKIEQNYCFSVQVSVDALRATVQGASMAIKLVDKG
jgi:hypothetical protein